MMKRHGLRGFTLLELLVVMVLLALMLGLVAPNASRWLEAAQVRGWRVDLKARIEALPVRVFLSGEALSLDIQQLQRDLPGQPGGLELRMAAPLRYSAVGMAAGGELELWRGSQIEVWTIQPVTGEVVIEQGARVGR